MDPAYPGRSEQTDELARIENGRQSLTRVTSSGDLSHSSRAVKLFRKRSFEQYLAPDELSEAFVAVTPWNWVGLTALFSVIVLAMSWVILGSIPTRAFGSCVLADRNGIRDLTAATSGRLEKIFANVGDRISKGTLIARIIQPERLNELRGAERRVAELEDLRDWFNKLVQKRSDERGSYYSRLQQIILRRIAGLTEDLQRRRELAENGSGTWDAYRSLKRELDVVTQEVEALSIAQIDSKRDFDIALIPLRSQIDAAKRDVVTMKDNFSVTSDVVSSYEGVVIEVKANEGDILNPGAAIMSIDPTPSEQKGLAALAYIPAGGGVRAQPGMAARIIPSNIGPDKYGYLFGTVETVAEFPTSPEKIQHTLQNSALSNALTQSRLVAEVRILLVKDPHASSGYKWSSTALGSLPVRSGTLCSAIITLDHHHPIRRAIPSLQRFFGEG
jgi:HlyD family secretion protein